jgi:uncharacterized protein (TIGR02246 family)
MRKTTSFVSPLVSVALLIVLAGCEDETNRALETSADSVSSRQVGAETDSSSIMQVLANWERGWAVYDPVLTTRDYATDADFTNAFGMRRVGQDSIRALLERVFKVQTVTAGTTQYEYHDLKFLSPEIALLRSRAIREGQQLADGTPEIRHINHLRVFARAGEGWQIVSHLISDERIPGEAR